MTKLLKHCVAQSIESIIPNFSCRFLNSNFQFWIIHYNCSNESDQRNLQDHVKKVFCFKNCFYIWINCPGDLKNLANSRPSASNSKKFFSFTRTIFSPSRSEPFWKQNLLSKIGTYFVHSYNQKTFWPAHFF